MAADSGSLGHVSCFDRRLEKKLAQPRELAEAAWVKCHFGNQFHGGERMERDLSMDGNSMALRR